MAYRNSYCEGSHGLSIGSLGMGGAIADVQNVLCVELTCLLRLGAYELPCLFSFENVVMVRTALLGFCAYIESRSLSRITLCMAPASKAGPAEMVSHASES